MNPTNAGENLSTPTMMLKQPDLTSVPEIDEISEMDFRRFIYTGISATVDLPLVKNSRNALFGVNIDGFIPPWNSQDVTWGLMLKNYYPVQPFSNSIEFCKIRQEMGMIPEQALYLSHRVIAGNVGIGVRLSSNTSQSGNVVIAQASGVLKYPYTNNTQYTGMQFLNTSSSPIDYSYSSFMLGDVSLNRNISITPIRRDPTIQTDLAKKLSDVRLPTLANPTNFNVFGSQFQEDWLLFGILSSMANNNSNQLTFSFFFDYSQVQFYYPLLPTVSTSPTNFEQQILEVTFTLTSNLTPTHANAKFLPADEAVAAIKEQPKIKVIDKLTDCFSSSTIV